MTRAGKQKINESIYYVDKMATESGFKIMDKIIKEQHLPISIFAVNDETALGIQRFCRAKKLHVPKDIAVVGFSDIELIRTIDADLTTVKIPSTALGEKVARMLIDEIESENPKQCHLITLPVEFVVRGSTTLI